MIPASPSFVARTGLLIALGIGLAGCKSVGGLTGAVAGAATGAGSGNPAVAVAVGVGVKAAVDAGMATYARTLSEAEQSRIATAAGNLATGEKTAWEVRHALPFGHRQGEVMVVRSFDNALTRCKEALFTMEAAPAASAAPASSEASVPSATSARPIPWFATTVCQGRSGWKWALAEPAVDRWGSLQ